MIYNRDIILLHDKDNQNYNQHTFYINIYQYKNKINRYRN